MLMIGGPLILPETFDDGERERERERQRKRKRQDLMSEWRTSRDKKQDEVIYKNEIKTESELTKIKERDKQLSVKDF